MDHRTIGYSLLAGSGIEIGALHNPAKVPACCHVTYCDAMSAADARKSFPELAHLPLVNVSHIVNLDADALSTFADATQDFVIINHVIEHVANPIRVIIECFRILRNDGKLVMSAPDMRFTFDRDRALTTPEHLWLEYYQGVTDVTDEHYAEFLRAVHPEVVNDLVLFQGALLSVRDRREHAHVWASNTFQSLLQEVLRRQSIEAQPLFENLAEANQSEYFSVWQKGPTPPSGAITRFNPGHTAETTAFLLEKVVHANQTSLVLRQSLTVSSAQISALTAQMNQLQSDVVAQQQSLHAATKAHADQSTADELALKDKQRHIENMEAQLTHVQETAVEQSNLLTAMQQSRSWRWTRMLRRRWDG